ncbi:unnamed protein product [Paramecium primaurelia]|uniref:MORN repeat protein n=1 Tax=Paramecium primaurelia TaxID=5886 RepID=A0A8S1L8U5_PARPR|nr:unnamed protein product [Paramecium primaurelia]
MIWQMEREFQQMLKEVSIMENGQKIKLAVLESTIAMMDYTMKDNGQRTNSMVLEKRSIQEVLRQIKLLDECYEGEFFRGVKQGAGKLTLNAEEFYEGEFQNGMMHGKGTYTWKNKKTYTGEWKEGQMDGFGIMKWEDGRYYEGNFQKGKYHGEGTFVWKGKKYVGAWINGYQEGEGTYYDKQGQSRVGIWKNGKRVEWVDDISSSNSIEQTI